MEGKIVKSNENQAKPIDSKIGKMEVRWRELYQEGKRGVAILDILCIEFFYNHRNSIYRILDISKLRTDMKA